MWVQEDPLEEEIATHSSFLPGDSHGQRSLAGYNPEGHKESDRTEGTQHIPTWEIRSITDDFIQMTKNKARRKRVEKFSEKQFFCLEWKLSTSYYHLFNYKILN